MRHINRHLDQNIDISVVNGDMTYKLSHWDIVKLSSV